MKKGLVYILLALAIIVLVSPGLIGKIAEESMTSNLEFAATETDIVTIESQAFDRSWFSSQGQHRVELRDGELYDTLFMVVRDNFDALPALVINTRIDHGLVPVSSLSRERGSLAPGLGRAISTLQFEFPDYHTIDLSGTVFSELWLTGELTSNLVLGPGSFSHGGDTIQWGDVDLGIGVVPNSDAVSFSGEIDELVFADMASEVTFEAFSFYGEQRQTAFGLSTGTVSGELEAVTFPSAFGTDTAGPISVTERTWQDGDTISFELGMQVTNMPADVLGRANIIIEASADGLDGEALGNITQVLDNMNDSMSDEQLVLAVEDDARQLLAAGFQVRLDRVDLQLRGGTVSGRIHVEIEPGVVDDITLNSILVAADASLDLSIPAELYDYFVSVEPSISAAAGMGFLRRNGDVYEMQASMKDGLAEVNGAPMPIPLPDDN